MGPLVLVLVALAGGCACTSATRDTGALECKAGRQQSQRGRWFRVHVVPFHAKTAGHSPYRFAPNATWDGWTIGSRDIEALFSFAKRKDLKWSRLSGGDVRVQFLDLRTGERVWVLDDLRLLSLRPQGWYGAVSKVSLVRRAVQVVACSGRIVRAEHPDRAGVVKMFRGKGRITPGGSVRSTCKGPLPGTRFRNRGELLKRAVSCGDDSYAVEKCIAD
jgi:hypothetical protein